jgi:hypothetical protein
VKRARERRRWGQTEEDRERAAERARREARLAAETFLLEADAFTFALIERFGIPAVRRQLAENVEAYRAECERARREHARRTMADALKVAAAHPSPSFRIMLHSGECERWRTAEYRSDVAARRKRAGSDLAKLGCL